ncbi:hypothetical protein EGI99_00480 [Stutzerimonas stutzeri]|nr:hypothetical protein JF55_11395 [Pseudomonas sp. 1-7]RRV70898.1 hypothetical protein EGI99_00480 [Stutzerimonas stutzeri]
MFALVVIACGVAAVFVCVYFQRGQDLVQQIRRMVLYPIWIHLFTVGLQHNEPAQFDTDFTFAAKESTNT